MGEAKRKAAQIAKIPEAFKAEILKDGRLHPRFDPRSLNNPHLLIAYVITTNDLEESEYSDCSGDDVDFWLNSYDRGLTLYDLATSWANALVLDLDDVDEEDRDGSKIYGYEREFLLNSMTGNLELTGKVDSKLMDHLICRELTWAFNEATALDEGAASKRSYGLRLVRLLEAHNAGVTLQHIAQAVDIILDM